MFVVCKLQPARFESILKILLIICRLLLFNINRWHVQHLTNIICILYFELQKVTSIKASERQFIARLLAFFQNILAIFFRVFSKSRSSGWKSQVYANYGWLRLRGRKAELYCSFSAQRSRPVSPRMRKRRCFFFFCLLINCREILFGKVTMVFAWCNGDSYFFTENFLWKNEINTDFRIFRIKMYFSYKNGKFYKRFADIFWFFLN